MIPFTGKLKVERLTIPINNLDPAHDGLCIVQLSDFHYDGQRLSEKMLAAAIRAANAAQPDLVALTGDFVTKAPEPAYALAQRLKRLVSRNGIVAVLGNHDNVLPRSRKTVMTALEQVGITTLWNAIAYPLGPSLPIVGLADYWSGLYHPHLVMDQLNPQVPRIVLSHNPDTAATLQPWRVDLQLSGHTHGGQVVIPGIGPVVALNRAIENGLQRLGIYQRHCHVIQHIEWISGWHQVGRNQLYVNRGLGTYAPGRLFCPPEVTVMRLTRSAEVADEVFPQEHGNAARGKREPDNGGMAIRSGLTRFLNHDGRLELN